MSLKEIEVKDVPDIIQMGIRLHEESPTHADYPIDPAYSTKYLESLFGTVGYGVIEPGVGFMFGAASSSWHTPEIHAYEMTLYIVPEKRGSSLAFRMVKMFEDMSRQRNAVRIHVGSSVGIDDEGVTRLYEALGYSRKSSSLTKELKNV